MRRHACRRLGRSDGGKRIALMTLYQLHLEYMSYAKLSRINRVDAMSGLMMQRCVLKFDTHAFHRARGASQM